jgi:hypothetical protein
VRHAIDFDSAMPPPREVAGFTQLRFLDYGGAPAVEVKPYVGNAPLRLHRLDGTPLAVERNVKAPKAPAYSCMVRATHRPRERRERRHVARSTSSADPGVPPAGSRRAVSYLRAAS